MPCLHMWMRKQWKTYEQWGMTCTQGTVCSMWGRLHPSWRLSTHTYWGCMQQVCYSTMKDRWELLVSNPKLKLYFHHSWHNWKCSTVCNVYLELISVMFAFKTCRVAWSCLENLKHRKMYSNPIHTFLHKHSF